ncbi:hypothetical protein CEXT_580471 [Caerostris extrusa]|uniref:Uncharacterized protein n=1 Tax=Caerostris extrusa TaxID=172846 RepID=A0AAV4PNF3_CAEEX|nr:hypothetical protein CEXT_580471 [Caerostris extrusa]
MPQRDSFLTLKAPLQWRLYFKSSFVTTFRLRYVIELVAVAFSSIIYSSGVSSNYGGRPQRKSPPGSPP